MSQAPLLDNNQKNDKKEDEQLTEQEKEDRILKEKRGDGFDQDMVPPDNGPWYCSFCNWIGSLYERFDKPFVTFFIVQNINHGLWISAVLAVKDYYKEYLGLDPGEMQIYISIIHIPWSFKILYGLISDNVPIFGTRRKSWLIIMGIIQFITIFSLAMTEPKDPLAVALILATASLSEAFVNVVSDAIMVIQSRRDPQFGSQDFVTLMYISTGFGGCLGCIYGGLMTQYSSPKWCWFYYSFMGLIIALFACFLTKESELDAVQKELTPSEISTSLEDYESQQRKQLTENGKSIQEALQTQIPKRDTFCYNLKKNCQAIGRAILMREIYQLVIFFLLQGVLNPTFSEFSYFFLLNVIKITKLIFAILILVGQICHIIGALVYKAFCRAVDTRWMILFAMITSVVSTFLNFVFAKRWNKDIGIDDIFFLFFTDVVFSTIQTLLYTLPIMALFAKITPKRIEGTTFAFLTGTMNFASTVISPGMGTLINHEFVHVNKRDLSNYSTLCLIAFICAILTFVLLPLIPTKLQIREFRDKRDLYYEEIKQKRRERRAIKQKKKEEEIEEEQKKLLDQ